MIGSPIAMSQEAIEPSIDAKSSGINPPVGRTERTLVGVIFSPALISVTARSDRRNFKLLTSEADGPNLAVPNERLASRTSRTSAANSCGSSENAPSGPPSDLRMVMCFSKIVAPRATAPGQTVEIEILRGVNRLTVKATLVARVQE